MYNQSFDAYAAEIILASGYATKSLPLSQTPAWGNEKEPIGHGKRPSNMEPKKLECNVEDND